MATTVTPTIDPVLSSMRSEIQLLINNKFTTGTYSTTFKVTCSEYTDNVIDTTVYYSNAEDLHNLCIQVYDIGKINSKILTIAIHYGATYPIEIFNYWTLMPDDPLISLP